jgi:hypothetical protein
MRTKSTFVLVALLAVRKDIRAESAADVGAEEGERGVEASIAVGVVGACRAVTDGVGAELAFEGSVDEVELTGA